VTFALWSIFLSPGALPHHPRMSLELYKRVAPVGPFRRFADQQMIAGLPARTRFEITRGMFTHFGEPHVRK